MDPMRKHRKEDNTNQEEPREEEQPFDESQPAADDGGASADDAGAPTPGGFGNAPLADDTEYIRGEPVEDDGFSVGEDDDYSTLLAQKQALEEEVEALREERERLKDQALRTRADFDNYRKRLARETEQNKKMATENLLQDLLPVLDNLELAIEHAGESGEGLTEGVRMVYNQMHEVLGRHGLEKIESKRVPFDPNVHEALMQAPSNEIPDGHVLRTFQTGYSLAGRVIRPAKVVVSQGIPPEDDKPQESVRETQTEQPEGSNGSADDCEP